MKAAPTASGKTFDERSIWWRVAADFFRSRVALAGLFALGLIVLLALAAPWITPQDPYDLMQLDILDSRLPPGTASSSAAYTYWLGTDGQGRDLYSAILYGLRISLLVGVGSAVIAAVIGTAVGLLAAYAGGKVDALLMRLVDLLLSFPTILMALMILAYVGKGVGNVVLTLVLLEWAYYARTARGQALVEAKREYVEAARGQGIPASRLLLGHILPNCLPPLLVIGALQVARAITLEATLSFLGLGVPITEPSLGLLISNGYQYLLSNEYWISFFPGIALLATIVAINLVGDQLRDVLNPRLQAMSAGGAQQDVPTLDVRNLQTRFRTRAGVLPVVDGVSFTVRRGRVLGLVGESGSGKSVTGFSIMGLVDPPGRIEGGEVLFQGQDLLRLSEEARRRLRGNRIAMIFQDPMATLNPVLRVDTQMIEAVHAHQRMSSADARRLAADTLASMGLPSPAERLLAYPHQLSGGMRQRIAIAIALLHGPDLIIADEPTTALDVTIQAQILSEMQKLVAARGMSMIWISHDLSVVAGLADDIAVMYAGRIVEHGPVDRVLDHPQHPYTQGLIGSLPSANRHARQRGSRLQQIPGMAPNLLAMPSGCAFMPRCARATAVCETPPPLAAPRVEAPTHLVRCFHPGLADATAEPAA